MYSSITHHLYITLCVYHPVSNLIIFWRVDPLYYRLPPLGECSRNLSGSVYQLVLLWEAAYGFSEFFWRIFAHIMMGDLHVHLSILSWVFSSFWPKKEWPPYPTLPIHLISPWANILFVSPDEKSPPRGTFCWCGIGETKPSRSTKGHQNWRVQKLFWAVEKNFLIGVLYHMENSLKVTDG